MNKGTNIYELLSGSFHRVRRLFGLAYAIAAGTTNNEARNSRKTFLPGGEINKYNVLINGRYFFDQPFNDLITFILK